MYKLYKNNCFNILPKLKEKSIDLILTDLPYGITKCIWDKNIPNKKMWKNIKKVIKTNGIIALFGTEPFSSRLRISNIQNYRYDWIWHKSRPSGIGYAKYQPMRNTENISIFYFNPGIFNKQMEERAESSQKRFAQGKMRGFGSGNKLMGLAKIKTKPKQILKKRNPTTLKFFASIPPQYINHPTEKPVLLLEYLIKTYTNKNGIVLDFTMGSGSTGVACINTNRNFIGIEKEKKYYEIAKKRLKEAKNKRRQL